MSFVSTTDLAEAVTGIVYYYTAWHAAFATSVILLKPGAEPIGSIEISAYHPVGSISDMGKDTLVTTS